MISSAMTVHGSSLLDYHHGNSDAQVLIRRDDGFESILPVKIFFRSEDEFLPHEIEALNRCHGHVLDIGAGSGIHSLVLQSRGLFVTALDLSIESIEIMKERGVKDVICADIMSFENGPYDTLLLLGHGIGMVEDIAGLNRFLRQAHQLLHHDGHILLNSVDVRATNESIHLEYHKANQRAEKYFGEIRVQFVYKDEASPHVGWLHVDPQTLSDLAAQESWNTKIISKSEGGEYLAQLEQMRIK